MTDENLPCLVLAEGPIAGVSFQAEIAVAVCAPGRTSASRRWLYLLEKLGSSVLAWRRSGARAYAAAGL